MNYSNYEIDLDTLRPDLDGTKYLLSAIKDPYGTPYKTTIGRLVLQTGKDAGAIQRAISRALEAAGYTMYPREAIATLQLQRSNGEVRFERPKVWRSILDRQASGAAEEGGT